MSYTPNLSKEFIERDYLVKISPRRRVDYALFSLVSGSIYKAAFDFGSVSAVSKNGTALTLASSSAVASGEYYFDGTFVYVFGAPIISDYIIVTYDLFLSTGEYDWYSTPTDSATALKHWEPYVIKAPDTKQSLSELLLGFQPVSSTNISADNSEHFWERHIYDSSFHQALIKVWHKVGDLDPANLSLVFSGFCSNISYSTNNISIQVNDDKDIFDKEFRVGVVGFSDFYNTTEFPNCDPQYIGKPKRRLYGFQRGVKLVNLNYSQNNGIGDNNKFGISIQGSLITTGVFTQPSFNIDAAPAPYDANGQAGLDLGAANTSTRLYFTHYVPFIMSEHFWYDNDIGGAAGAFREVTAVGANYIDFTPAAGGVPVTFTLRKFPFSYLYIEQDDVWYSAIIGRDFDLAIENGTLVANFNGSYQANIGMPNPIKHTSLIHTDETWGLLPFATFGGSLVGEFNDDHYINGNGPAIVYEILKSYVGIPESEIDGATFISLVSTVTDEVALSVPDNIGDDYPTFKDLLSKILATIRCRLFKNDAGKWTLRQISQMGAYDKQAISDEIIGDISFDFDYTDIVSYIFVEYWRQEKAIDKLIPNDRVFRVSSESLTAKYLHGIRKQKTFQTYHVNESEAQAAADEFAAIYGDRQGRIRVQVDKRFFDTNIGDVIEIKREDIPGFSSVEGTEQTRKAVVIESTKNLNNVSLTLDDQKGLEEN